MPQFRDYPEADSIEDTDAFVIDRVGTGTMWVPESVLASSGASAVGFSVNTSNIHIPIDNGYQNNGGWYFTFDNIQFDAGDGVTLSFDYAALPHHTVQNTFYSPSTAYIAPSAGIYQFTLTVFMQGEDQNNVFQCGMTHKRSNGTDVYDNNGDEWSYNSPTINLAPASGAFDNGVSISLTQLYNLEAGDIMLAWFVRGVTDQTMLVGAFGTSWSGFRVA